MSAPPRLPAAQRYALRFISGKYQGTEYALPDSGEVVIGRSNELEVVLVEDMVSRRHSRIVVSGGQIAVEDLGSTNGTYVNGEKVERANLQEGDRLLIGTSILKLVLLEGSIRSGAGPLADDDYLGVPKRTTQVRAMTGSIQEVPLPDLIQLFSGSRKSGVLSVRSGAHLGRIYLQSGAIVFASVDGDEHVPVMKSLLRIFAWEEGVFEMEAAEARDFPQTLEMSTEGILMEVMRQIDEMRRLGPDMPPASAKLALAVPLIPPLHELSAQELDVLQLAHNYNQVGMILNKSVASDPETSEIIVKLLRSDYLRVI
ncbi:MAG: DUF4388 domain-containing protein [Polyangiales bacterium]